MEVVLLAAGLNTLLPRIWDNRKEKIKERQAIDDNIEVIRTESNRLEAALEDAKFKGDGSRRAMELKQRARVLSQQTRDCIQRFFKDKKANCTKFAMKTERYSKDIKDLCDKIEGYSPQDGKASKKPPDPYVVADPMVMAEPVKELLDLVMSSEGNRKVISIVGFPGLGKTLLAKLVYDRTDCPLRARVTAAAKDADEVLREILTQFDTQGKHENNDLWNLGELLKQHLLKERYLIVIDDIQSTEQWAYMRGAFPVNGTIIVTTTIQSVAIFCSSFNGYVYKLSPLDDDKSLHLFLKDRPLWGHDSTKDDASDILKKCDGLPLAIVSMSQLVRRNIAGPTGDACRAACTRLDAYLLEENGVLKRLRWVLMNKYTGLTGDALRSCLLYYCLYKHKMDAVPRRNSLIRRWEAEGFLVEKYGMSRPTDVAAFYLETLVDRNIIQSMEVGTNGSTRRCRPPGMMVEYISHISKSENFAALVCDAINSGIRRLSFHPSSARDYRNISRMKLNDVLTLAVSGIGCEAILDFKKYDLIAVLDLKECTNLNDSHVTDICKLLLLKYLSLGETIGNIPRDIGKLTLLETLEMRTTETVMVYEEVLELPNLKHLLGKFELIGNPGKDLKEFLSKDSVLETVTGFVTKTARGFPQLMQHMNNLRKVKIYCAPTASKTDQEYLQREIKAFTSQSTNDASDHSLSIDFAEFTGQIITSPLEFLKEHGSLGSLKLRGDWRTFCVDRNIIPDFTKISGIKKICLSRTYLSGTLVLSLLTNLIALEYLKLDEQDLGPLQIKSGTFQNLTRLCLVGERSLHGITIEDEALHSLVSLHLICKALHRGMESSIGSGRVKCLAEITLDSEVHKRHIQDAWKTAAKGHPNRPQVLLIKKGAPIRQA